MYNHICIITCIVYIAYIYIYIHLHHHIPYSPQVLKQELQLETSTLRRRAADSAQRAQALQLRQAELVQRQAAPLAVSTGGRGREREKKGEKGWFYGEFVGFQMEIMEFHGINWISCRIKERWGVTLEKLESNRKLVKLSWKYES